MLPSRHSSMPPPADRRWKPLSPHCPRCDSSNTKFCYYNNYSLSQPRYFCKGCRRYWTMGGSLRNVPVGGGCRKNHRKKPVRVSGAPAVGADREFICYGHQQQSGQDSRVGDLSIDAPAAAGGSAIDLAELFAKFSDQYPYSEPGFPVPELPGHVDSVSGSSESNSGHQMPVQVPVHHLEFAESQALLAEPLGEHFLGPLSQQSIGEFDFCADPSGMFELLPSPVKFVGNFSSDLSSVPDLISEAKMCQSIESVPVESKVFHHNLPISDWSS